MNLHIEIEQEDDGRWIAEVPELPGVLAYGPTPDVAAAKAESIARRALVETAKHTGLKAGTCSLSRRDTT